MRRLLLVVVLWAQMVAAPAAAEPTPTGHAEQADQADQDWWTPWYLVDYGLIASGAAAYLIAGQMGPRDKPLLGPQYDPENPTAVLDEKYSARIGHPFADDETAPAGQTVAIIGAMGGALILEEGISWLAAGRRPTRRTHDTIVGFLETTALTAGATEIAKTFVGRLRPDFQDRAARHLCNTDPPAGLDCAPYVGRPLASDPAEAEALFEDGRKSFWSGHSSLSFSTFTYLSLVTGGRWVWGANATPTSRALGIVAQTLFMTTAAFIAGSRLDDGRHHVTDVVVGTAVGLGLANFSYWRRFDGHGESVRSHSSVRLVPGPASGLSLVVEH